MIERLRRTTWNWLPTFLEVAETGSVIQASRNLSLTPAAVSRTLRLLEEELGHQLFNRVGRTLALNKSGAVLRDAVRSAQRGVDAGLSESLGDPFVGPLRAASIGVLTEHFVVACLLDLKIRHPSLSPEHVNAGTADANAMLSRGRLDVAFYYEEVSAEHIVVQRIGELSAAVYCGRDHPLFSKKRVTQEQLIEHPFSVPQIGDTGRTMDGWPPELQRTIGMRITMLRSNLLVCLSGTLVTVLPDVTAAEYVAQGRLRRFNKPELPGIEIFSALHESASDRGGPAALIDAVSDAIRSAPGPRRSPRR